jgi:serine protease AprX
VPASSLDDLANDPDVAYVTPDRPIKPTFDNITNGTISASYMNSEGWIGTGVGVAIIDSGVVDLPDFHTGSRDRIVTSSPLLAARRPISTATAHT